MITHGFLKWASVSTNAVTNNRISS
jgi:hypothetical protein